MNLQSWQQHVQVQDRLNSSMENGAGHEVSPRAEELLATYLLGEPAFLYERSFWWVGNAPGKGQTSENIWAPEVGLDRVSTKNKYIKILKRHKIGWIRKGVVLGKHGGGIWIWSKHIGSSQRTNKNKTKKDHQRNKNKKPTRTLHPLSLWHINTSL